MLVSVLMSVYNGEAYVGEAVESILNQTLQDFEFIIINDGSTDRTAEILARYERQDPRVRTYSQARQGLIATLNRGIELSRGKYVARMDADDVSYPTRLEKQAAFLEAHPEVGVCGTWRILSDGRVIRHPVHDAAIRSYLVFDTMLAHPTVMMRKALFERGMGYPAYEHAEDFGLWVQLAGRTSFANLPEVLLYYRLHPQQVAQKHRAQQAAAARRVRETQLRNLHLAPTAVELETHQSISEGKFQANPLFLIQSERWLRKLVVANQLQRIYPEPDFSQVLSERWYDICSSVATQIGIAAGLAFWRSPLRRATRLGLRKAGLLIARCAFGCWPMPMRRAFISLCQARRPLSGHPDARSVS